MSVSFNVNGKVILAEGDGLVAHLVSLEGMGDLFEVTGEVMRMCFCGYISKSTYDVLILTPFPEHWRGECSGKLSSGLAAVLRRAKATMSVESEA